MSVKKLLFKNKLDESNLDEDLKTILYLFFECLDDIRSDISSIESDTSSTASNTGDISYVDSKLSDIKEILEDKLK